MSTRANNGPPPSPMEALLSNGRQVLHFRPGRWDRWSQSTRCWRQPVVVWINKPPETKESNQALQFIEVA